jgi:hypothetical protein
VIKLDLVRLSRRELEAAVIARCSQFGSVASVVIMQYSDQYDFALASVEMSTRDETLRVLSHLGDNLIDGAAVIRIEQL